MLECPHLDSILEVLRWIPIVENGYTMPDNKTPVGIDDVYCYSTCFKPIFSTRSYFGSIQIFKVTIEAFATQVHVSNARVSASRLCL